MQWRTSRTYDTGHSDAKFPTERLLHRIEFTGVSCQEVSNLVSTYQISLRFFSLKLSSDGLVQAMIFC